MKYTPKQADFLRKQLAATTAGEDEGLLRVVAAVPESKLGWKPTKTKSKSFLELAWHAGGSGHFFCDVLDGKSPSDPPLAAKTKKALVAQLKASNKRFQKRLAAYTPAELAKGYEFFGAKWPGIVLLSWHKMHLVHHRGQLSLYLRIMGAKVPGVYGPSGDEQG
jgi:uncharacterized damage-inducible protein DinB